MVKTYSPWIEDLPNGKHKYCQRYVDPLRSTPKHIVYGKVSVTLAKKTPQVKREAYKILLQKIDHAVYEMSKGTNITLQELTDKYQQHLKETERPWNTRQRALGNFKFINQYFKGAIAKNVTTPMINKYLEYCLYKRKRKLSNSSTRLRKVYLSNAYRFGIKYGYVKDNPVIGVSIKWKDESKKKRERIENKYLTDYELRAILGYSKFIAGRQDYYYLFKFMSFTGMRVSEAAGITKKDFKKDKEGNWYVDVVGNQEYHYGPLYHDEEEGKQHSKKYGHTKTDSSYRKVLIDRSAFNIYLQLKDFRSNDQPLFLNNYFKSPWNTYTVDSYMKKIAHDLGIIKPLSSHYFRHTYISKLAEQGQSLRAIMAQVGQSDSQITKQIYTHVTEAERDKLRFGLEQFNDQIGI